MIFLFLISILSSLYHIALSTSLWVSGVPFLFIRLNNIGNVSISSFIITGITDFESEGISIYPNPASNILTIETPIQSIIEISNIEGQLIKTFATTTAKTNLVISEFSNGVYTVEVFWEKGVAVKKFVKE